MLVEDRIEGNAVVTCFKNAAVRKADIENIWIMRVDRDSRDSAAHHGRTDRPRFEILEQERRSAAARLASGAGVTEEDSGGVVLSGEAAGEPAFAEAGRR